jgi:hypothetical protein
VSRLPATETLELIQGSTLDETWSFEEEDGSPSDFTGHTAELRIAKDTETAPMLVVTTGTPSPSQSALEFHTGTTGVDGNDPSTLRIYLTDEDLAELGLEEEHWLRTGSRRVGYEYGGVNTLLFTNGDGETTVENLGPVIFRPIVEPE